MNSSSLQRAVVFPRLLLASLQQHTVFRWATVIPLAGRLCVFSGDLCLRLPLLHMLYVACLEARAGDDSVIRACCRR